MNGSITLLTAICTQRKRVEMDSCNSQGLVPHSVLQCQEPLSTVAHTVPHILQGHSNNLLHRTQCFSPQLNSQWILAGTRTLVKKFTVILSQ